MPVFRTAEISNVLAQLMANGIGSTVAMAFGQLIAECEDDGSGLLEFFEAVLEQLQLQTPPTNHTNTIHRNAG
jgi:hypothetical protein